jgi:hypothetical protein
MANPYPASFIDSTGKVRLEGELDFTDSGNQPGGGGGISEIDSGDSSVTITDPTGPNVDLSVANSPKIGGVAITGTPSAGQVPVASGAAAAAWGTPALRSLFSVTLGSDGVFDQTSIPQTASDLLIVFLVRGTDAGTDDQLVITFNNDTAAHYGSQDVFGNSAAAAATQSVSAGGAVTGFMAAAAASASLFTAIRVWVTGYSSTVAQKSLSAETAYGSDITSASMLAEYRIALWNQTAAISRVGAHGLSTANLKTGSQMRIYGLV